MVNIKNPKDILTYLKQINYKIPDSLNLRGYRSHREGLIIIIEVLNNDNIGGIP